ncbi:hypothetical protein H2198_002395 [Neophaeococcomyces mojaviensis]|uniref:Uncharacterized protein n=1 Tax=Neophaeococcomyces mojaviensis TaxID=3383035 RepID=A0ACC3AE69_9EURO|nr:hypothetical protein H2198_002395 [Knufia sp. JES_112]
MTTLQPTAWRISLSFKRVQLQQIATAIGAPLTGTKPQLLSSIHETVAHTQKLFDDQYGSASLKLFSKKLRVLSIDMGIRNLAYAVFDHKLDSPHFSRKEPVRPHLANWERISLGASDSVHLSSKRKDIALSSLDNDGVVVDKVLKESFEPIDLAAHACQFARYCASLQPTHILIERQRFRSAGHVAVQEWSLRVGMLEAMLYAAFQTLIEEKILHAALEPILPARVNKYWFDGQHDLQGKTSAEQDLTSPTGKQAKLAKIALASHMLNSIDTQHASFTLDSNLRSLANAFPHTKTTRNTVKNQSSATGHLSKLDDLSDSLLQGLAFLQWQENRLKIIANHTVPP